MDTNAISDNSDIIYTDIAIIGGGAAGITAAIFAAREGKRPLLIERGARLGKKLLSTGNGRCNLSHTPLDISHFHGDWRLAKEVFEAAGSSESFFLSLGLRCRTEDNGCVYPYSNTATSVLDALRFEVEKLGVKTLTNYSVSNIEPLLEGFKLMPSADDHLPTIHARRVIVATGGKAAPSTGSDGSIFPLLERLGVKISPPIPSLFPIKTSDKLTKALKGVRANATCSAVLDGKTLRAETGELQFGDGVLSGICCFNLSRYAAVHKERLVISVDFAPDMSLDDLSTFVHHAAKTRHGLPIEDFLTGLLHKRIAVSLLKQVTDKTMNSPSSALTVDELESLVMTIKDCRFPVYESYPWQNAQCTAGGVDELLPSLASKKHSQLYFAGEAVNVDGDCGGYNLAWAWASGEIAGKNAARSL